MLTLMVQMQNAHTHGHGKLQLISDGRHHVVMENFSWLVMADTTWSWWTSADQWQPLSCGYTVENFRWLVMAAIMWAWKNDGRHHVVMENSSWFEAYTK